MRLSKLAILLAVLSVALRALLPASIIESLYSRGVFVGVRYLIDLLLGWLPMPLFYLFWLGILMLIGGFCWHLRPRKNTLRVTAKRLAYGILGLAAWLTVAFLWLWGFNYGRVAVEDRLEFATYQPSLDELSERVYTTERKLARLREEITRDTFALTEAALPADLDATIRPLLAKTLLRHGYPAPGRPRAWQLLPRGVLLRLGTAGVYWPWAAQGNIDAGLHPLQKPAVMAHELAHAYGFGGEGTCSFWGYLLAAETDDPGLRYTLELAYWRHLAGRLRFADPENYLRWRASELDPGIRNDLEAIYANGEKYRDIASVLRDATYTAYLKAQGVHDGLLSYGRVVQLVEGYRRAGVASRRSR